MLFNETIGIQKLDKDIGKINVREAVRAIIFQKDKILLMHSNKGYVKLPGGGVEKGESHSEALRREVAEETGFLNCEVKDKVGVVTQRHMDEYDPNAFFEMNSHYYLCGINSSEKVEQQLDEYESAEEFTPEWLTLDEALKQNEWAIKQVKPNGFIKRENMVFQRLKKI